MLGEFRLVARFQSGTFDIKWLVIHIQLVTVVRLDKFNFYRAIGVHEFLGADLNLAVYGQSYYSKRLNQSSTPQSWPKPGTTYIVQWFFRAIQ